MRSPWFRSLRRSGWILSIALSVSGCWGAEPGPTSPAPAAPLPQIAVRVNPTPLRAAFLGTTGAVTTFRIAPEVILTESAGTGGEIEQITTTVTTVRAGQGTTTSTSFSVTMTARLRISPYGTVTYAHLQEFGFTGDVASVTWRFAVSGVDTRGRAFTASSQSIAVDLDASQ
jgi:hypothetical protein